MSHCGGKFRISHVVLATKSNLRARTSPVRRKGIHSKFEVMDATALLGRIVEGHRRGIGQGRRGSEDRQERHVTRRGEIRKGQENSTDKIKIGE